MPGALGRFRPSPEMIRSRVADVNDGVLAVAGLAEGLAVMDVSRMPLIIAMAGIAGAVSVGGAKYSEEAAELEVQRDLIREEQRLLELSPEEEIAELVEHFQAKGLSQDTARAVAEELSAVDALSAQLETEYGITEVLTPSEPFREALGSGLFFLLGSLVPVLVSFFVPRMWVEEYIVVGVAISLVITALVLSKLGHTRVLPTILRSLLIGAAALGAAVVAGNLIG